MVKTHQVVTTLGSGLASCLANVRFGILVYHSGSKTSDLGVQHPDLKAGGATVGAAVVVDPSTPQLSSITCFILAISRSLNLVRIVNRTLRHMRSDPGTGHEAQSAANTARCVIDLWEAIQPSWRCTLTESIA